MNFDPASDGELIETMRLLERERPTPSLELIDRLAAELGLEPGDRRTIEQTADLLTEARPLPRPSFRGGLRRRLSARPAPPRRLRLRIAAYAGSGALLLVIAGVGLAGIGPLAS